MCQIFYAAMCLSLCEHSKKKCNNVQEIILKSRLSKNVHSVVNEQIEPTAVFSDEDSKTWLKAKKKKKKLISGP